MKRIITILAFLSFCFGILQSQNFIKEASLGGHAHVHHDYHKENAVAKWLTSKKQEKESKEINLFTAIGTDKKLQEEYKDIVENILFLKVSNTGISELVKKRPELLELPIPSHEGALILDLAKVDLFDGNELVTSSTPTNEIITDNAIFYRGVVRDDHNTIVAASVHEDYIRIMISNEAGNYVIARLPEKQDQYVFYNAFDLKVKKSFTCHTPPPTKEQLREMRRVREEYNSNQSSSNCVPMYIECDYDMYQTNNSSINDTKNYVQDMFNEVATIYQNESIDIQISEIFVWTTEDPYAIYNTTLDILQNFKDTRTTFNGRLAHFLTTRSVGGGIAYLEVLCSNTSNYAVSGLFNFYNNFPEYSWDVYVFAHEAGHNFGSPHTQGCYWGPNDNQRIDDCGNLWALDRGNTPEGQGCFNTNNPIIPSDGGTIMSYCHLNDVGVNFSKGFGQEPGDLIRSFYNNPTNGCLLTCDPLPNLTCNSIGTLTINNTTINITTLRIQNIGDAASVAAKVSYYLSTNNNISTSDFLIGTQNIPALNPGQTVNRNFNIDVNSLNISLPNGALYVGVIIDNTSLVTESNEGDNDCFYDSPRFINGSLANLTCSSQGTLTLDEDILEINISELTITNNGNALAGSNLIGIAAFDEFGFFYDLGLLDVPSLAPNESFTFQNLTLSYANLNSSTYDIVIYIDAFNDIPEFDESDNTSCSWQNIIIELPDFCSERTVLTTANGMISDGSGVAEYQNNTDCEWLIRPEDADCITLSFDQFDVESFYDYVEVYDGGNRNAPLLGAFTGFDPPPSLTATSGRMLVVFVSDFSVTYDGWSASYTSTTLISDDAPNNQNLTGSLNQSKYEAKQAIQTTGNTRVNAGRTVEFVAGQSITLRPGFWARPNSTFTASLGGDCFDNSITQETIVSRNTAIKPNPTTLSCYPNPTSGSFNVDYTLEDEENVFVGIYDMTGKLVDVIASGFQEAGKHSYIIAENIEAGLYFLVLKTEFKNISEKLVILE